MVCDQFGIRLFLIGIIIALTRGDDKIVFEEVVEFQESASSSREQEEPESDVNFRFGNRLRACSCMPNSNCRSQTQSPTDGAGQIDIRIVTTPPAGVVCEPGLVYCCCNVPQQPARCGTRRAIQVPPDMTPLPGQASFGEYPWAVLVLDEMNNYVGGAVLIGPRHVLTAAHKVSPYTYIRARPSTQSFDPKTLWTGSRLKVRLGEWNARVNTEPYKYRENEISWIAIHPQFNANNLQNDVAVITLRESVSLTAYPNINAACMTQPLTDFTGQRCWVSGWGKDVFGPKGTFQYIEKEVEVPILSYRECEERLRVTRLGQRFSLDRNSFLCAGGEPNKDACTGDGGSALVCETRGQFYVAGMVAWGVGCADPGVPGVYVNVPNFQEWINQQTRT